MYEAKQRKTFISRVNWNPNKHSNNYADDKKNLNKLFIVENHNRNIKDNTIQQMFDGFLPENYNGAIGTSLGSRARNLSRRVQRDSNVLRESLVGDSNVIDPSENDIENQAHHIVEAHNPAAQESRKLLNLANIHINAAINGVFLPTHETDDSANATVHYGSHSHDYSKAILKSLWHAIRARFNIENYNDLVNRIINVQEEYELQEVISATLMNIRNVLLTQNVPINSSSDPDYTPNGPKKIQQIFQDAGIL